MPDTCDTAIIHKHVTIVLQLIARLRHVVDKLCRLQALRRWLATDMHKLVHKVVHNNHRYSLHRTAVYDRNGMAGHAFLRKLTTKVRYVQLRRAARASRSTVTRTVTDRRA